MYKNAIALTGGIATGKSTVAQIFNDIGYKIIDADKVAHEVLDEQKEKIIELFGDSYVDRDSVNRGKLGRLIFSDIDARRRLEDFMHPLIRSKVEKEASLLDASQKPYLIDVPLFYETGGYNIRDVIVVYASRQEQLHRLMRRNGYSKKEALGRIASQIDIETKRHRATYVIDNSGDETQLKEICLRLDAKLKKERGCK